MTSSAFRYLSHSFQLSGLPGGQGHITSQVIGETRFGALASNRCNMVVPVRAIPIITTGLSCVWQKQNERNKLYINGFF